MKRQKQASTAPELELRRKLHAAGLRYRVDQPVLPDQRRRADLVFTKAKVAVFVDGCFWHVCPQHATWPKSNAAWWRAKLAANVARDHDTMRRLSDAGWTVVRVWEHERIEEAANRVMEAVQRRPDAVRASASDG
jgi:DNA mismatch endonuclease, patch repair protein